VSCFVKQWGPGRFKKILLLTETPIYLSISPLYINLYAMGFHAQLPQCGSFFLPSLPWQRIKSMRDCDVFVVLTWRHYLYVCSCSACRVVISAHEREARKNRLTRGRPCRILRRCTRYVAIYRALTSRTEIPAWPE
jgi:hypothetical protein